ncbi:MAG: DUF4349 domain-containing protein [Kiritimatiellaeota bacterium]|nr:DUF4349 domain-containing protein [Kiritimatiellota bacterium]
MISIKVGDVPNAVQSTLRITNEAKGYLENKSDKGDSYSSLTLRVPSPKLKATMAKIAEIGSVTSRRISSRDVTEQYIDVKSRLKNKIVLRDRLRKLLDKAKSVPDILAIEKELNRVQSDIDSMRALMKALNGKIEFAKLNVYIKRGKILGPLGYLVYYLGWGLEKLFVIQK